MKFKEGDKVMVKAHPDAGYRVIAQVREGYGLPYVLDVPVKGLHNAYNKYELELAPKLSFDTLEVGDKVYDEFNDEYVVLAKLGRIIGLSDSNAPDVFGSLYTINELKESFSLPEDDEVKELTLEEVANLVGVDISKVRIKD